MHLLVASLVTNLGNAALVGSCALGVAFMLRFLVALTKEQKASRVRCRFEYRISCSLPDAAVGQVRPLMQLNRSEKESGRGELFPGTLQAPKKVALTREIRLTGNSWQRANRV